MKQVTIENPVINSPFVEPQRHFRFTETGITDEIVEGRRSSSYFIPVAPPKMKGKAAQETLDYWTQDRLEENTFINQVRQRVAPWRQGGYSGVSRATARLLEHWQRPERQRRLFFCQVEALETIVYITEAARRFGDNWVANRLKEANEGANPALYRIAFKMATGSGKTVVMAMLIAWHTLNKLANPQDARFSDAFLLVTPGITIRDRLRVLLPGDPHNYYRRMDLIPADLLDEMGRARIVITNYHAFKPRERETVNAVSRAALGVGQNSPFTETPEQMVRRVCRELGTKKNIVVINDEAHHCYRRKPETAKEKLEREERQEAEKRNEEARVWITGLEAIKDKLGLRAVYDLSATPFFLRGSGYTKETADGKRVTEGILFPWVISDFSLIDAIESGIVKVPRVPVETNQMAPGLPTYRDLWPRVRERLPKKGRAASDVSGMEPKLPVELEGALLSLYGNYETAYRLWEQTAKGEGNGQTPPVFIVVCNNTNVSKLVFDYIAGWERKLSEDASVIVPGKLALFSNEAGGKWRARPYTILVDSEQLESGEAMSEEFKKIAALEIEEFKHEYKLRFPGRSAEKLTDEDILREVMNTVGKAGKLGELVRCVVSVSMLTEGWDANTVTHILGIRAFGTQLLCEQVVGRGLRRMSYEPQVRAVAVDGRAVEVEAFPVEYAEVYGVPFSFIPCSGSAKPVKPRELHRVRALEDRMECEISFPRLIGYRYEMPGEKLTATFTEDSKMVLSTQELPTETENAPIVGESSVHDLDYIRGTREQQVAFMLAKLTLERYFQDEEGGPKPWLFPQLLRIVKAWMRECVYCKDNTFKQMLLLSAIGHEASDRIYQSIVASSDGQGVLKPILRPYDHLGSTRYVDFDTSRPVYPTDPTKCHVSHVVADTESWEQKMAQALAQMDEVVHYVKNQNLGFTIPYTLDGVERSYYPDFLVRVNDGQDDLLNLLVEVSGENKKDKAKKVSTARNLWVPAVNNHGGFGRWAFLEITDPWDAINTIRAAILQGTLFSQEALR